MPLTRRPRRPALAVPWVAGFLLAGGVLSGCGGQDQADARALFAANCAVCHGSSGGGTQNAPPLDRARYLPESMSDAEVAAAIRDGVPARGAEYPPMPGFTRLSDDEVDALVGLVRELQGRG